MDSLRWGLVDRCGAQETVYAEGGRFVGSYIITRGVDWLRTNRPVQVLS